MKTYNVKRELFFGVTFPTIKEGLTKKEAIKLANKLNTEEDDMYVNFMIHEDSST